MILPHLKHVLESCQDCIDQLPGVARLDLALSLIESVRFPNMAWKRFAVDRAHAAGQCLKEPMLQYRLAAVTCPVHRIDRRLDEVLIRDYLIGHTDGD